MCQDLEATKDALKIGLTIQDACCLNTKTGRCCPFLPTCAYQDQRKHTPTVWIAAHEILFLEQEALGDFEAVIIDEFFHLTRRAARRIAASLSTKSPPATRCRRPIDGPMTAPTTSKPRAASSPGRCAGKRESTPD